MSFALRTLNPSHHHDSLIMVIMAVLPQSIHTALSSGAAFHMLFKFFLNKNEQLE